MAMDFISGPTSTVATTTTTTPDSDTDTPPHPPPPKRVLHHHHVSYKECLKNHAASIGGHALDGCCEFMPGPTATPSDPTSLTCAACGCHRNFHRRDPDDPTPLHHLIPAARKVHSPPSASQLLLSLGHANSPSDHEILQTGYYNNYNNNNSSNGGQNGNFSFQSNNNNKKRYRTKFSQQQKEKMHEFSEKIGWKLKKGEERLVEEFCNEAGVDRTVFKVWMHNNKHSSTGGQRREKIIVGVDNIINTTPPTITTNTTANGNHGTTNNNNNNTNNVGLNNCGGLLSATTALEFNFANAAAQEAKAQ